MRDRAVYKDLNRFIKIPLYFFAFVLLGLFFGYLTFKILSFSRTVEVPNIVGKNLLESNRLLSEKGLYLKIEGEDFDPAVPAGNVIRQDIPAGNKIKERRGIKVVISKGPRVKSVPLIVNESITSAESMLLQKGLKIARVIAVHSDIVEKDRIIAQRPGPEEQVSDTFTVLVSLGPYERIFYCPDFKGMPLDQADVLIRNMNLKPVTEGEGQTILSQKPEPGKHIRTGDTIYLKLF
ncbi:MAG: PASTA domain-containing protein [Nitrospirota bacterium]